MSCFGSDTSQIMKALILTGTRTRCRKRRGGGEVISPQSAVRIKRSRLNVREMQISGETDEISCAYVDYESEAERELSPACPVLLDFDVEVIPRPQEEVTTPLESSRKTIVLNDTVVDDALISISSCHPSFDVQEQHERLLRTKKNSIASGIWTSKYAPMDCCSVLGNDGAMLKLSSWLLEWKLFIEKDDLDGIVKTKEQQKKKSKQEKSRLRADCRKAYIYHDSSDDEEFDMPVPEEMPLTGFIAYGLSGVGKSAAVHALAQEMGFTVLEINPASCKDARQILTQSLEATQSHRIKGETKSSHGFKNLFSQSSRSEESKAKETKNTLILIDDADVLPEGEELFLSTLETMLRKTKRPVVFTVSGLSKIRLIQTENLEVGEVDFLRQSTIDVVCYIRLLCLVENVVLENKVGIELVNSVGGDLRAAINLAQFWASSPPGTLRVCPSWSGSHQAGDPVLLKVLLNSSSYQSSHNNLKEQSKKHASAQLVQNLIDVTLVLTEVILKVAGDGDILLTTGMRGCHNLKEIFADDKPVPPVPLEISLSEYQSAFAQLVFDGGKANDRTYTELVPLTGTTEDPCELPISTEDRFYCRESWSETAEQYTDALMSLLKMDSIYRTTDFTCTSEIRDTGRLLFKKYGRRVPHIHARGSQFGPDYWTFFRAIAHSEFLRREQEQITKRRRLRFYHYLGPNGMHLTDEFLDKLSYSMGEGPPEMDPTPSSL